MYDTLLFRMDHYFTVRFVNTMIIICEAWALNDNCKVQSNSFQIVCYFPNETRRVLAFFFCSKQPASEGGKSKRVVKTCAQIFMLLFESPVWAHESNTEYKYKKDEMFTLFGIHGNTFYQGIRLQLGKGFRKKKSQWLRLSGLSTV